MPGETIEAIDLAGAKVAIVRESEVRSHFNGDDMRALEDAMADVRAAFEDLWQEQAVNCSRIRVESKERGKAWLHTLRAGLSRYGVTGGKDYTSIGFETPAMWVTVVDANNGLPIALIEADYLSRVRTAAVAALATELLAPAAADCLAHFGAGKISELLVKAVLKVRPSVQRVLLVRRDAAKGVPCWLSELGKEVAVADAGRAIEEAEIITTATSSRTPVIPPGAKMPRARHLNLMGSNRHDRQEIPEDLARRCVGADSYLVVEDAAQAKAEAGDFVRLALDWKTVPTVGKLLIDPEEKKKADSAALTVFKSVGLGVMDLAVATGVLRRIGLLPATDLDRRSQRV